MRQGFYWGALCLDRPHLALTPGWQCDVADCFFGWGCSESRQQENRQQGSWFAERWSSNMPYLVPQAVMCLVSQQHLHFMTSSCLVRILTLQACQTKLILIGKKGTSWKYLVNKTVIYLSKKVPPSFQNALVLKTALPGHVGGPNSWVWSNIWVWSTSAGWTVWESLQ